MSEDLNSVENVSLFLFLFLWLYLQAYVNLGRNCSSPVCVLVLLKIGSMVSHDRNILYHQHNHKTYKISYILHCVYFICIIIPSVLYQNKCMKIKTLDIFLRLNCWSVVVTNTVKPACSESVSRIRKASLFWCPAGFTISILSLFQLEFMCVFFAFFSCFLFWSNRCGFVLFACLFACSAVLCVMCMYHCTVPGTLGGRFVRV